MVWTDQQLASGAPPKITATQTKTPKINCNNPHSFANPLRCNRAPHPNMYTSSSNARRYSQNVPDGRHGTHNSCMSKFISIYFNHRPTKLAKITGIDVVAALQFIFGTNFSQFYTILLENSQKFHSLTVGAMLTLALHECKRKLNGSFDNGLRDASPNSMFSMTSAMRCFPNYSTLVLRNFVSFLFPFFGGNGKFILFN